MRYGATSRIYRPSLSSSMARITAASMPRLRETYSHVPSRLTVMKRPSHIVSILPVIENPFLPGEVRVGWERACEGKRNLQFAQPVAIGGASCREVECRYV